MRRPQIKRNIDWKLLRELLVKGFTYEEVSKTYDVPMRTLVSRSQREKWNIAGIRAANRTPRKFDSKDSRPQIQTEIVKNGVVLPLIKLANHYQACDVASLLKFQSQFLAFANAALKFLACNDPKQAGDSRSVNLQILASGPVQVVAEARQAAGVQARVVDCQSSEKPAVAEGSSPDQVSESASSASDLLG